MLVLLLASLTTGDYAVEVRYTETAPIIDGYIEELWYSADSACNFTQQRPKEGEPSTEPTVVYVLADDKNIYFAVRSYTPEREPFISYMGWEDHVYLFLDTFNNKTTAYFFSACASGYYEDGLILENGAQWDWTWDGVWFNRVKCYDDRMEAEFKIPLKSIRYKKDVGEWGFNVRRAHVKDYEESYWVPVTTKDKLQISTFGRLTNITAQSHGYHIELYPEAFFRYDRADTVETYKPNASFNFKWDITSQSTINGTVNPDFAQIESDPFILNLSRHPLRLEERRPFFQEGSEVFRLTNPSTADFLPLDIFYSRRIGKPLPEGGSLPILAGLKFFHKEKRWNVGMLSAVTDETTDEPFRGFFVMKANHSIFTNSEVNLLMSSSATDVDDYNYAIGIDGAYRKGTTRFVIQSALSDYNKKLGWAITSGLRHKTKKYGINASFTTVQDSFDVSHVGYVPWVGYSQFFASFGPRGYPSTGILEQYFIAPALLVTQEPEHDTWSKVGFLIFEPRFRNLWGASVRLMAGKGYDADTNYFYRSSYLNFWTGRHSTYNGGCGFEYAYQYNYYRMWLANQLSTWVWFAVSPVSPLNVLVNAKCILEWNPDGPIEQITPHATPRIEYKINRDMAVSVYSQFVFQVDGNDISTTKIYANRIGVLYSWNFRPKSWLYVAFNDYRVDTGSGLEATERIGAIKLKYLFYF
jgi:hypothetical protein